jgi:hypothetical protein
MNEAFATAFKAAGRGIASQQASPRSLEQVGMLLQHFNEGAFDVASQSTGT